MKRNRQVLRDCLRKDRLLFILLLLMTVLNGGVFSLYGVMAEPFLYSEILILTLTAALFLWDLAGETKAARAREQAMRSAEIMGTEGIEANTLRDEDYAAMIRKLTEETERLRTEFAARQQADDDYYTAWIHQVKTPIAVMKLYLHGDTPEHRALSQELFRIEQYVEMVLDYIRLESDTNDLFIREYPLDEIIRETLRKFAPQFISKRLRLVYTPADQTWITDRRWLSFILEQLLSNAVKYTPKGEIRIYMESNAIVISDTGIGIASEDLPRIFEKGYTGVNGRLGQRSSGLGLFLTRKAARLLAVNVRAESTVGKGSTFFVEMPDPRLTLP